MKIYNILDVLPTYRTYEGLIIPPKDIHDSYIIDSENNQLINNVNNETVSEVMENEDTIDDDIFQDNISIFLDNDDEDFVKHNLLFGEKAERHVENQMIKNFGNCEKVNAKEGYDFKVRVNDRELKIEVKSIQTYSSAFHFTINEINHAIEYLNDYFLCFVLLPSIEKGVQGIRYLCNPIDGLGIILHKREYPGLNNKSIIMPEKFLIKPVKGFIVSLTNDIKYYL